MVPIRVTIIGGGMSGIAQAVQLQRALGKGVVITVIERSSSPGGTWRDSTWPGAGVDIPIHLYSLYFAPKTDWKRVFASQKEVMDYLEEVIESNNLQGSFVYNTTYLSSSWSNLDNTHTLILSRADGTTYTHTADVLISANGPLSTPLLPKIPGIDSFQGISFHNLHWRNDVDFTNKKVAVIGSGSSGIQLVPGVAEIAGVELVHYVRSGGYFFPKVNTEFSRWQQAVFRWAPGARLYHRLKLFLAHNDRWDSRNYIEGAGHDDTERELLQYLEAEAPAEYLEALTPRYPLGCKRPAYDAGWLASLHRPNVSLISKPIARITEDAIVNTDGTTFKPDIIIYATGSDVARQGVGLNVGLKGQDGIELKEYWESIGGPQSYQGLAIPGFPNYFTVLGPNAVAGSWGFTIGNQSAVIARLVKEMVEYGIVSLQPRQDVFEAHNRDIQNKLLHSTMNSGLCVNWWRVGGQGRLSVPNALNAIGLWRATRSTNWADWVALAKSTSSGKPTAVNVRSKIRRKRARQAVLVAIGIGAVAFLTRSL